MGWTCHLQCVVSSSSSSHLWQSSVAAVVQRRKLLSHLRQQVDQLEREVCLLVVGWVLAAGLSWLTQPT